ncbi:MAG: ORF6N domain-containing protein, partial [Spirochaetales bacterium]|nr:ORF6N domain-containing protein [Spirochaetales bacterium]
MAESDVKSLSESIYSQEDIRNRIYTIRGVQVMLDSDLAAIYGYSTTAFNQQVKNNAAKFEGD